MTLPDTLLGDAVSQDVCPRSPVWDLVASSLIPKTSKGHDEMLPPWKTTPELVVNRVAGTVPETSYSRAVPSTRMVSDMGPTDREPALTNPGMSGTVATVGPGVGQMKLDTPPRYSSGRRPGVRVWLSQMERYMRLMRYPTTDWLDIVAMRVDGAASSWMNAQLAMIERGQMVRYENWDDFRAAMIAAFEPVTENEEARKQLRALRQTGKVSVYISKFQELQCRLPGMNAEEAFSAFLNGLTPHLQEQVGAHVQGDLEAAKRMALRMDMYRGNAGESSSQGAAKKKGSGQQPKGKGAVNVVDQAPQPSGAQVMAVQGKGQQKGKGKGRGQQQQPQQKGQGQSQQQGRGRGKPVCFACGGSHPFYKCNVWLEVRKKCGIPS